jgi:hypothetical protein
METFLKRMLNREEFRTLNSLAQRGVAALASATPVDSGITASSWGYVVTANRSGYSITWTNTSMAGKPLAIMLQYGHGTGTGGYVRGRDYINPAMRPIFDQIADEVWRVVVSS